MKRRREKPADNESYYLASQWTLMARKLRKHKLAVAGGIVLAVLYATAAFAGFLSPYFIYERDIEHLYAPPARVRLFHDGRIHRPFVYRLEAERDPETWAVTFVEDRSVPYPVRLFVRSWDYKLLGVFETDVHLFGVEGLPSLSVPNRKSLAGPSTPNR